MQGQHAPVKECTTKVLLYEFFALAPESTYIGPTLSTNRVDQTPLSYTMFCSPLISYFFGNALCHLKEQWASWTLTNDSNFQLLDHIHFQTESRFQIYKI